MQIETQVIVTKNAIIRIHHTPLGVMDTRVLPRQEMQIQGMVATAMATEKTKMVLVVLESQSSAMQGRRHNDFRRGRLRW